MPFPSGNPCTSLRALTGVSQVETPKCFCRSGGTCLGRGSSQVVTRRPILEPCDAIFVYQLLSPPTCLSLAERGAHYSCIRLQRKDGGRTKRLVILLYLCFRHLCGFPCRLLYEPNERLEYSRGGVPAQHLSTRCFLVVETVIVARVTETLARAAVGVGRGISTSLGELEVGSGAGVLHLLGEGLVPADLDIRDRPARQLHRILVVALRQLRDRVLGHLVHVDVLAGSFPGLGALDVKVDRLLDGELGGPMRDEAQVGTREAVRLGGDELEIDIRSNRRLPQLSLENAQTAGLVGQGHIDQRVQTTGTAQSRVELLRPVGSANDKDILLRSHTIHFYNGFISTGGGEEGLGARTNPNVPVRSWLTTRSEAPPASPTDPPRALAIESNSSRKTIQGAAARALSKMSRMLLSDSPNHMLNSSGPLTEMKLAAHSLATALANIVLPVPGGP